MMSSWSELCRPGSLRGHLSDNPQVENVLQSLLFWGPAAWLLVCAPFRIAVLKGRKLVLLPNRRLYVKIVSTSPLR